MINKKTAGGLEMSTREEFNRYGEELIHLLRLQTSPVAVRMLASEADIPAEAVRPRRDKGEHWAQCQAVALSRRDGFTVAMCREDNWCPAPLMAYGLVQRPESRGGQNANPYNQFEYGKYIGILTAPWRRPRSCRK
jgi:uncharacterized protein (DUF169 family)